jgi:plastocyanin
VIGRAVRPALALSIALAFGVSASSASAATFDVAAGPPLQRPPAGVPRDSTVDDFYPRSVTVHPGDRVKFGFFGFHNVVFPAGGQRVPGLIAPDQTSLVSGVVDAANAAFWFNGQPRLVLDARGAMPTGGTTVDGSKLVSSGLPLSEGQPKPFVARFTKRGSYTFFCTVHPGMRGTIKVVPRSRRAPTKAQNQRRVDKQLKKQIVTVKKLNRFRGPKGNVVQAGSDQGAVSILRFFPKSKTVKAGTTVRFQMPRSTREIHTISFGPQAYLDEISRGSFAPVSTPGVQGPPTIVADSRAFRPSDPPPLPAYTGTNHGNGFLNTGPLGRSGPFPPTASITFSTPGTYHYICLIHPEMHGTVVVKP